LIFAVAQFESERLRPELRTAIMAAVHWVEIVKCEKCGKAGLAELWDHDAFEGHADLVPPGFKMTHDPKRGRVLSVFDPRCPSLWLGVS
jgi:hypothetical protein